VIILGLNAYHPDSSACIIKDGQLIAAAEEERFCRIKHWAGLPKESIRYCLTEAGIGLEDLDYIALNRNPYANFHKKVNFVIFKHPSLALIKDRLKNSLKVRGIKDTLAREFSIPTKDLEAKVYNIEHHRAHLASSFFVSPFNKAAIVSLDGFGDFTSGMVASGVENRIKVIYEINYPHSLGLFYTAFTQFLGFKDFGDEYKVMGLSAFGRPKYTEALRDILILKPQGRFKLNLDYFSFYKRKEPFAWDNAKPILQDNYALKFIEIFGEPRTPGSKIDHIHCDIARSVQEIYEEAFFHILNYAFKISNTPNLCLAGGCALNSLANGKIFNHTPFKEIYIQPASSDAGGSLGAGYYLYHQLLGGKRSFRMTHAYWGPQFSDTEIKKEIDNVRQSLNGCAIEEVKDAEELCSRVAKFIAEGRVVGWFQGRMEWGPRALGNRSILADPRRPKMKDILNARIKKREWFRPFAPSVLVEKTQDYFQESYPEPFMLKVYPARDDKKSLVPAVINVDGTGRLQTVSKEENPLFWQLINKFEGLTGIPILLNTSFNENEPIICNPREALDCFLRTKMDVLVLGNYIVSNLAAREVYNE